MLRSSSEVKAGCTLLVNTQPSLMLGSRLRWNLQSGLLQTSTKWRSWIQSQVNVQHEMSSRSGEFNLSKWVNGKWIAFIYRYFTLMDKALYNVASHPPIQTHTDGGWAAMQGAGLSIASNLGFSVLPKDTSTHGQKEPEIEPGINGWPALPLMVLIKIIPKGVIYLI